MGGTSEEVLLRTYLSKDIETSKKAIIKEIEEKLKTKLKELEDKIIAKVDAKINEITELLKRNIEATNSTVERINQVNQDSNERSRALMDIAQNLTENISELKRENRKLIKENKIFK